MRKHSPHAGIMPSVSCVSNGIAAANYYDVLLLRLQREGVVLSDAVEQVADAYLDGKPQSAGKKKRTNRERDGLFWASQAVADCPRHA